jgi:FeS assembly SUF system regulator
MLRMTKLTDYGMVLLMYMSLQDEGAVFTARDLSAATRLPLPMVSKILKALARGDVLLSHRGVKGGYSLARNPQETSVADIISALEGPIALTECIGETPSTCEIELLCPVRSNWQRINQAVLEALEGISLAEMARPLGRHRVVMHQGARQQNLLESDASVASR